MTTSIVATRRVPTTFWLAIEAIAATIAVLAFAVLPTDTWAAPTAMVACAAMLAAQSFRSRFGVGLLRGTAAALAVGALIVPLL